MLLVSKQKTMKIKTYLAGIFLVAGLALTACTVNVNPPGANANNSNGGANVNSSTTANSANQKSWSVVVCASRAKSVTLSAGANENDGEIFATWQQAAGQRKFDLPPRLQTLQKIYLKGSASDKNQVEMCVLYDGKPKKRVEFDDDEDVMVKSDDVDDLNKCRCTE